MTNIYVMDACGLLAFLNAEQGGDIVEALLQKAKAGERTVCRNAQRLHRADEREIGCRLTPSF